MYMISMNLYNVIYVKNIFVYSVLLNYVIKNVLIVDKMVIYLNILCKLITNITRIYLIHIKNILIMIKKEMINFQIKYLHI